MLALEFRDIDLEEKMLTINKSLQRFDGKDIITDPKTPKGNRKIALSDFLVEELRSYMERMYGYDKTDRVFPVTKFIMEKEMERCAKESGVKKIRVHDLRHSHVSYLINLGVEPLDIAQRLGHEKIQTTLQTYGHLYPNKSRGIADIMNEDYISRNGKEGEDAGQT